MVAIRHHSVRLNPHPTGTVPAQDILRAPIFGPTLRVMRRVLLLFAILLAASAACVARAEPFRLLTIGNSFSKNATTYLESLALAADVNLEVHPANIGGGRLSQHWEAVLARQSTPQDPSAGRLYQNSKISLQELLDARRYDAITLQQFSLHSTDYGTFQPFASNLHALVKQLQPAAEVIVLQTWSYRDDSSEYKDGQNSSTMHAALSVAYDRLAADLGGLRQARIGDAFALARLTPLGSFRPADRAEVEALSDDVPLPTEIGSLYAGSYRKNGRVQYDTKHANTAGCYLGACVLFETLLRRSVVGNPFAPGGLSTSDAAALQAIAHAVVTGGVRPAASRIAVPH